MRDATQHMTHASRQPAQAYTTRCNNTSSMCQQSLLITIYTLISKNIVSYPMYLDIEICIRFEVLFSIK